MCIAATQKGLSPLDGAYLYIYLHRGRAGGGARTGPARGTIILRQTDFALLGLRGRLFQTFEKKKGLHEHLPFPFPFPDPHQQVSSKGNANPSSACYD